MAGDGQRQRNSAIRRTQWPHDDLAPLAVVDEAKDQLNGATYRRLMAPGRFRAACDTRRTLCIE